jgi:hypothetical protein
MGVPPHCLDLRVGQTECMASPLAPPDRQAPPRASAPASPQPSEASAERVLVVGYDGSPGSRAAIAEAARRGDRRGRLIIVRPLDPGFGEPPAPADRRAYQRAVASLLAAVRSELHPSVPYELRVVACDVSSALADVVRRHHGAELVIGDSARPAGERPNPAPRAVPASGVKARDRGRGQGAAPRIDPVHQCGLESFPASDPPSWWGGSPGA